MGSPQSRMNSTQYEAVKSMMLARGWKEECPPVRRDGVLTGFFSKVSASGRVMTRLVQCA